MGILRVLQQVLRLVDMQFAGSILYPEMKNAIDPESFLYGSGCFHFEPGGFVNLFKTNGYTITAVNRKEAERLAVVAGHHFMVCDVAVPECGQ